MNIIPVIDTPAQVVKIILAGQPCTINLYQKSTGLYCDLYVGTALIIGGVVCQNMNRIVINAYLGFVGDLFWQDTQGTDDPTSPGLGARFIFWYLESSDYP